MHVKAYIDIKSTFQLCTKTGMQFNKHKIINICFVSGKSYKIEEKIFKMVFTYYGM